MPDRIRILPRSPVSLTAILRATPLSSSVKDDPLHAMLKKDLAEFAEASFHMSFTKGPPEKLGGKGTAPRSSHRGNLKTVSDSTLNRPAVAVTINGNASKVESLFRNAFDIPRSSLIGQIAKMRANLQESFAEPVLGTTPLPTPFDLTGPPPSVSVSRLQHLEDKHSLPISQMGNYQDYARKAPQPLRDIEPAPVRMHAFGNPFKVDKRMMVDEADIIDIPSAGVAAARLPGASPRRSSSAAASPFSGATATSDLTVPHLRRKRKPGPLPKDFQYKWRKPGEPPRETAIHEAFESPPDTPTPSTSMELDPEEDAFYGFSEEEAEISILTTPAHHEVLGMMDDDDPSAKIEEFMNLEEQGVPFANFGPLPSSTHHDLAAPSDSDHPTEAMEGSGLEAPMPTLAEISTIRQELGKLVRKPGKDFDNELIEVLKGLPAPVQNHMARYAKSESHRFKKTHLGPLLEPYLNSTPTIPAYQPDRTGENVVKRPSASGSGRRTSPTPQVPPAPKAPNRQPPPDHATPSGGNRTLDLAAKKARLKWKLSSTSGGSIF